MSDVVRVSRQGGRLALRTEGNFQRNLDRCREVPGRSWDPNARAWIVPATVAAAERLVELWGLENVQVQNGDDDLRRLFHGVALGRAAHARRDEDPPPIPLVKTSPWRHQAQAYHFAAAQNAVLFNMGMGTGKSKVVIDLLNNHQSWNRVLILCPKSVIDVWPRQFDLHAYDRSRFRVYAPTSGSTQRKLAEIGAEQDVATQHNQMLVVVLNYEAARFGFTHGRLSRADPGSLAEHLLRSSWDVVVLDESHRCKQPNGVTSRFVSALRETTARRYCLTGTPMPHSPLDVFAQFRFLDPGIFGIFFTQFRSRYAVMGGYLGRQVIAYQNRDELIRRMDRLTFTAASDDVLDLPPETTDQRAVHLEGEEAHVYAEVESRFVSEVRAGTVTASNALVKLLRLQQITSGHVTTEDGAVQTLGHSKEAVLADFLEDLPADEPVAVFCRFVADLEAVRRCAEAAGRECVELSGRANDLEGGVWTRGNVLAVQIQSGGVGVDLTRARYCVYYSLGYSLGDYEQSKARVRRPGQTRPVYYVHLVAPNTVDEQVLEALQQKKDVVEAILSQVG